MTHETTQPIAAIYGPEPMRADEYPSAYLIGHRWENPGTPDVERIVYRLENYGDHGIGWFDIYAGGKRVASMAERHVAEVRYAAGVQS